MRIFGVPTNVFHEREDLVMHSRRGKDLVMLSLSISNGKDSNITITKRQDFNEINTPRYRFAFKNRYWSQISSKLSSKMNECLFY